MKRKVFLFTVFVFFLFLMSLLSSGFQFTSVSISNAQQEDVNIGASVQSCILNILLLPSDRLPNQLNTSANIEISFTSNQNLLHNLSVNTNSLGLATYNFCANNIFPIPAFYDFTIKGLSHLRKKITNVFTFNQIASTVNFQNQPQMLIAGETSVIFDNKINSLDISTQITNLGSSNIQNDLNLDGVVNTLDLAITRNHFFMTGD